MYYHASVLNSKNSIKFNYFLMGFLFFILFFITFLGSNYWKHQEIKKLALSTHETSLYQFSKAEKELGRTLTLLTNLPVVLSQEQVLIASLAQSKDIARQKQANRLLLFFQERFGLDIIWLLDKNGTCIASSNATSPHSLVGSNFKERNYFKQSIRGKSGQQFAVGKNTKIPGLFFSAPLKNEKNQLIGVIAIKLNTEHLSQLINIPNLIVTDELGVIIISDPIRYFLKALPHAQIFNTDSNYRLQRYHQTNFEALDVSEIYSSLNLLYLKQINNNNIPLVWLRAQHQSKGLFLNIVTPLPNFENIENNASKLFWISSIVGMLGIIGFLIILFFVKKLHLNWIELQLVNVIANRGRNPIYCVFPADNFHFYYVNDAMCQHYHYSHDQLAQKTLLELSTLHHPEEDYHALWERVKQERKIILESIHCVGEEKRTVELALTYVSHHEQEYLMGQIRDVTQEKAFRNHLEDLATKDPLTKILNRRGFFMLLEEYIIFHEKDMFISVLIFDIDFFKKVNDTYGHAIGDFILLETAQRVQSCLPPTALFCRYGGEEFVIALPSISIPHAAALAETIRQTIAVTPMNTNGLIVPITISIGCTSWNEQDDIAMQKTIQRADEALYQAKSEGRNQVRIKY